MIGISEAFEAEEQIMTFDELKSALQGNEVEITDADFAAFSADDAELLRYFAADYRRVAARGDRRSELESIAENYEWAAGEIERLAQVAA